MHFRSLFSCGFFCLFISVFISFIDLFPTSVAPTVGEAPLLNFQFEEKEKVTDWVESTNCGR